MAHPLDITANSSDFVGVNLLLFIITRKNVYEICRK